ncbi:hypothetical protein BCR44DRAFT_1205317 [Catenaria anguillulae PL171]|uniref:Uncharacterized protein n=1 Tax=Catenaria anguillulae PL171 TaxID=765915 RepID=A0A1Y2HF86_9FUNG|nr:hypothetical protein BCR44DRAFT_1205317 [Catenaria anguillulae PL171]
MEPKPVSAVKGIRPRMRGERHAQGRPGGFRPLDNGTRIGRDSGGLRERPRNGSFTSHQGSRSARLSACTVMRAVGKRGRGGDAVASVVKSKSTRRNGSSRMVMNHARRLSSHARRRLKMSESAMRRGRVQGLCTSVCREKAMSKSHQNSNHTARPNPSAISSKPTQSPLRARLTGLPRTRRPKPARGRLVKVHQVQGAGAPAKQGEVEAKAAAQCTAAGLAFGWI